LTTQSDMGPGNKPDREPVGKVKLDHAGIDIVIAVRTAAKYLQVEIDLGRRFKMKNSGG